MFLNKFMDETPCPLARLIYERSMFANPQVVEIFGKPLDEYLIDSITEVLPFIRKHTFDPFFVEFYKKYCIVVRETLLKKLRNKARQQRSSMRCFEDLAILIGEANFSDEKLLEKLGIAPKQTNTTCLTLSIGFSLKQQIDLLNKGFELDLYMPYELTSVFAQLRYIYSFL